VPIEARLGDDHADLMIAGEDLKLLRSSFAAAGPTHEGVAEQHPEADVPGMLELPTDLYGTR
jgi:hypothetical protein